MSLDKNKVVLGMSGGVDSSVAAYLLKEQGYDVIGVTMKIWQDDSKKIADDGGCCSLSAVEDARMVANKLGIPFYVMDFQKVFQEKVIDLFLDEYGKGRTPNPCIACNRFIKFEELLQRSHDLGAYYVATGHYAKKVYDEENDRYLLKKSKADQKDQTYALFNMTQRQLKHTLFPLGDFTSKEKIRAIADELDLIVADKPDSQEICFVDDDYVDFIKENADYQITTGNFVDREGNILGQHQGIVNYTIGQRRGLGITFGKPAYVVDINAEKNEVVIGDNKDTFSKGLIAKDLNFIPFDQLDKELSVQAKIRYNARPKPAQLIPLDEDRVKVIFGEVRAVTLGQAVVFYNENNDNIIGGGTIEKRID
jgi:tRNA-specific 2-thiouridylase